jgi:DME family drug/metabolite transporter
MSEYFALQAAFCFAISHILNRRGLVASNAITASLFSIILSAVVLWSIVPFVVPWSSFRTPAIWYFLAGGIFAPGLGRLMSMTGMERVGVGRSIPISNSSPMVASILAVLLMGESWTLQNFLGTSLVILGIVILSTRGSGQTRWRKRDLVFPALAALSFAVSTNLRKLGLLIDNVPLVAAAVTATTAVIFSMTILRFQGGRQAFLLPRKSLGWLLAGALTTTAAMVSVFYALSYGKVVIVDPLVNANPVLTLPLSALFLKDLEAVTFRVVAGTLCTVLGTVLVITA